MQLLRKLALALAFSAFFMPQPVSQAATAESAISILSVDGIGRTTATPDRASINIGVTTSAADASNAQRENDSRIQNIVDGLKELGIAAGDIRTDHYSFRPDYTFRESRGSEITGYTVDNSVIVKVKNVDLVGRVIEVNDDDSVILILLHEGFQVSGKVNAVNGATFLIIGDASLKQDGLCLVTGIDPDTIPSVGDEIVTSGEGGLFPQGIPIGVIESVDTSNELNITATLRPYADVENLNDIFIMVPYEDESEASDSEEVTDETFSEDT